MIGMYTPIFPNLYLITYICNDLSILFIIIYQFINLINNTIFFVKRSLYTFKLLKILIKGLWTTVVKWI